MKIEDPRVTDYALGELREEAREEFEKDLSQSDDLQRELEATGFICQKLSALPHEEKGFDARTREELREECLRNVRIVRREQKFRRAALIGALGALAACLLLAPFIPWTALLFRPNSRETRQGADDLLVAAPRVESTPGPANSAAPGSKLLASVESMPDPTSGLSKAQDLGLETAQPQVRLESPCGREQSDSDGALLLRGLQKRRQPLSNGQPGKTFSVSGFGFGYGVGSGTGGAPRKFGRSDGEGLQHRDIRWN